MPLSGDHQNRDWNTTNRLCSSQTYKILRGPWVATWRRSLDDVNWYLTLIPHPLGSHGFNFSLSMQMRQKLTFLGYLTNSSICITHELWPSFVTFHLMNMWRFLHNINKPSLVPIGLQLFKWGHFHILSITTWTQMTFDLDMQPWTSSTNEGSHVASMTQLWMKSIKSCGR